MIGWNAPIPGRSRDRDQTAQFDDLRMSLKAIDLYAQDRASLHIMSTATAASPSSPRHSSLCPLF
jgi:hypothetical protein